MHIEVLFFGICHFLCFGVEKNQEMNKKKCHLHRPTYFNGTRVGTHLQAAIWAAHITNTGISQPGYFDHQDEQKAGKASSLNLPALASQTSKTTLQRISFRGGDVAEVKFKGNLWHQAISLVLHQIHATKMAEQWKERCLAYILLKTKKLIWLLKN